MRQNQAVQLPWMALASILMVVPLLGAVRPVALAGLPARSDSSDVVAVVGGFHEALVVGDSARALAALAPDVLILETGGIEGRDEYRARHLSADIQFARAVPSTRKLTRLTVKGDAAWVVSSSVTQGQSNGRAINSAGAELVVLHRTPSGWQISAIHWSSRARRPS